MINRIVDELAFRIKEANSWIETSVGVVLPIKSKSKDGNDVIEPIYFNNERNYCNGADYISLAPNSSKKAISYFELNGNPTATAYSSRGTIFTASVTCVVWFRHTAINIGMFDNDVLISSFLQGIPSRLPNVENQYFRVLIDFSDIEVNNGDVFKKYSYNDQQQFTMYPYGYFAVKMNVEYAIPKCVDFSLNGSDCHNPKVSPIVIGVTEIGNESKVIKY